MKTTKLTLLFFLFLSITVFSQSRRVADRYYKEFAYIKAAKLYESIYKKGDSSSYIVKRIADSYYNNVETEKAEFWYNKLVYNFKEVEEDYLFKYAQTLRSNGKYKKSDSLLLTIQPAEDVVGLKEDLKEKKYLIDFSDAREKRISFRNLSINTPYSDFGGFIYDNKTYYASASPKSLKKVKIYKWNNQPFLNIYKSYNYIEPLEDSKIDSVLELHKKIILPSPINTQYHESTPIFTKDGKTMYFTRVNYDGRKLGKDKKQIVNLKLYKASLINGKWSNIDELPFNSHDYSVGHPALSPDEKTLYFVSDMPGGIGKTDLYKIRVDGDTYGEPINLGTTINTAGKEMFPFVGDDNTLYFSSNGHIGLGLLDVFQSKIDEENNKFDKPQNLGHPFNSKKDDFSFYMDEQGRKGFISSNRDKGKGDDDIYSFIIYDQPKPKKIIKKVIKEVVKEEICYELVKGIVRSTHNNKPIPYATVKLVDIKGELLGEVFSDEKGQYIFDEIPCQVKEFIINGSKQDFKPDTNKTVTTGIKGHEALADLFLKPLIIGNQIVISPIYFDYDKSNIREDAQYELENIVSVMNNHPNMVIRIEAHTDSRGSSSYNRSLSDRRAKATRDYLFSRGIFKERIEDAQGFGEDRLLNHCDDAHRNKCTEEEHQLNRRSYFYIVGGGEGVDIMNKKPSVIDKSLLLQKQKALKKKLLLEKLDKFRRGRSKRSSSKCTRDSSCS